MTSDRYKLEALIESRADTGGFSEIAAAAQGLNEQLDRIDGRRLGLDVRLAQGGALTELKDLDRAVDRLDGRTISLKVDLDDAAGAVAALQALKAAAEDLDGETVRIEVEIRGDVAALASLAAISSASIAANVSVRSFGGGLALLAAAFPVVIVAVGALLAAISPLLAILTVGVGAVAAFAGGLGLAAAAFGVWAADTKDASDRAKENEQQQKALKTASDQLKTATEGLAEAKRREAEVARSVNRANAEAMDEYRDSLKAVDEQRRRLNESERAVGDAVRQRQEGINRAVEEYERTLDTVEDRERDVRAAREQLASATNDQELAQARLVRALEDEQYILQRMRLDVAGIRLSLEESTLREAEAQERLNEAMRDGDPMEIKRAKLELKRIDLDRERLNLDLRDSQRDLNDAEKEGTQNLRSAREEAVRTGKARRDAAFGVKRAEEALAESIEESRKAEAGIAKARREGNKLVAESIRAMRGEQRKLEEAVEATEESWKNVRRTQRDGQRQLAAASRGVKQAQDRVAEATRAVARATRKSADDAGLLERAWRAVKKPVNEAFGGAVDEAKNLSNFVGNLAERALPLLGTASARILRSIRKGFKDTTDEISPREKNSLQSVLDGLGPIFRRISRAAGRFVQGFLNVLGDSMPDVKDLAKYISDLAKDFRDWTRSKEGREQIRRFLKQAKPVAKELADAIGNLSTKIEELGDHKDTAKNIRELGKAVDEMLGFFGDVNRVAGKVADGLNRINKAVSRFEDEQKKLKRKENLKALEENTKETTGKVKGFWGSLKDAFTRNEKETYESLMSPHKRAQKDLVGNSVVPDTVNAVVKLWKGLPGRIRELAGDLKDALTGPFEWAYKKIVGNSIVPDMARDVERHLGTMPKRAEDALRDLPSAMERRFREGADRSSAQIDRINRLKARGVEPDSPRWNSATDPNRGRAGYTRAEDGSWVRSGFYGGGSGSRGGDHISRDEWRGMMHDSHREGARELAKVLRSAKSSGADLDDVLDGMLGGYLERKNRSGPDAR